MTSRYIARSLEPVLVQAAGEFPVTVLVGPRQAGKTTLLRHVLGESCPLVSLEPPDVRNAAALDPRGFLALHPPPAAFDEIQYAPDLLPYIKERVDGDRDRAGQFILTGSQNLLLMEQVTESLAGRAAVLKLLPLTVAELAGQPSRPLPWETDQVPAGDGPRHGDVWAMILRGFFPELARDPGRDARLWWGSYVQTYLERDVRGLRNVGDLTSFQSFLRALAARSANLLNLSDLARDVGVTVNTAKSWLSVLEATFQVLVLRPHHANVGKRLVKSPKVYLTDTGLLSYLVGLREPGHAAAGPSAGALFESLVVGEIYKRLVHRGQEPAMYFWRTASGDEVDLVVEQGNRLIPIEAKSSATPRAQMATGIARFRRDLGDKAAAGFVIHPGAVTLPLGDGTVALPFAAL